MKQNSNYIGRFAPSPTGPLHLGSLVAAMASHLDARAHGGAWLVRVEDLDFDRNVAGADEAILAALARCGMRWDGDVTWQSRRIPLYEEALARLSAHTFPCGCSRREIADSRTRAGRDGAPVYPGTCRNGIAPGKAPRAIRLRVPDEAHGLCAFEDRWLGHVEQNLALDAGDFVLLRGDGFWAYQLAVVVDDGAQGVTDIVRGADLLDSTPRQLYLQELLGLPRPRYLHVPVVTNPDGEKLSKQTGARAFDAGAQDESALLREALLPAARFLGLQVEADGIALFWERAVPAWRALLDTLPVRAG